MESKKGIWLKTKDDGVLLFKNVSLSHNENNKGDNKDKNGFEHNKDTIIHYFEEEGIKFSQGSKHFHTEMQVFCTVTERTEGDDGKLKSIKVSMPDMGIENTSIDYDENLSKILQSSMDISLRVVQKSGNKLTIQGAYDLNKNFTENMKSLFQAVGLNYNRFKLFHNSKLLDKDTEFSSIFENGKDINIYAFESKPISN